MRHILLIVAVALLPMVTGCGNTGGTTASALQGTWQVLGIQPRPGYPMDKDDSAGLALANFALAMQGFDNLHFRGDSMFFDNSLQGVYRLQDSSLYLTKGEKTDTQTIAVLHDSLFLWEPGSSGALVFRKVQAGE